MQTTTNRWALPACEAIYNSTMAPAEKLEAIGHTLGFNGQAAVTSQRTARTTAGTATTSARRTRGPNKTASSGNTTRARRAASTEPLGDRLYNLVPETGGIAQTDIKLPGTPPNIVGAGLSRLRKAGRLIEQNGVWFRATTQQQRAA